MDQNMSKSKEILLLHALVSGRVQGVGFRATVETLALQLALTGEVRNLPDGRVEIYAQGSKSQLERLVTLLKSKGLGRVDSIATDFIEPTKSFEIFQITY